MGITIHQSFTFTNIPPQAETYMAIGQGLVYMTMDFDTSNLRFYTLDVPYGHWVDLDTYSKGFEPVYSKRAQLTANVSQMEDLTQFIHDSLSDKLTESGLTDFTVDYISN